MKNLLNMNKSSVKIKEYIDESKLLGLEFSKININESSKEFIIKNNKLIFPLSLIKSIGVNVSEEIELERQKGNFKDFYDFMIRCYGKSINKKVIIALIECGAFDEFKINKKTYIENIDEIINYASLCRDLATTLVETPQFNEQTDYTDKEEINNEIKNYGFYLSHHPVTKYDRTSLVTLNNIYQYFNRTVTSILFVEDVKTIKTKNNDKMSFIKLSDEIEKNNVYKIIGKIERRNNDYQFIIYNVVNVE